MPEVRLRYVGILRLKTRQAQETIQVTTGSTLRELLQEVGRRHGRQVSGLLLNERGYLADGLLVLLEGGGRPDLDWIFTDNAQATILVLSPMMVGG